MYFTKKSLKKTYTVGLLLVVLLVFLDLLTYLYYPGTTFGKIFLATREQTPLTWISSTAFLLLAFACYGASHASKSKLWTLLSATFFFFSMDDAVYFHERVSGYFIDNTDILNGFPTYIWVILYAPLLLFALVTLVTFLWNDVTKKTRIHISISIFILSLAVALDLIDGVMEKNDAVVFCLDSKCHTIMIHLMRLTEEVLEALAIGLLGYLTLTKYCIIKKESVCQINGDKRDTE